MTDRAAGPLRGRVRVLRAAALGSASLGLAVGAHLVGGGHQPPLSLLLVSAALLGLVAAAATARRVRLPVLLALLGGQQAVLHLLFEAGSAATACNAVDAHAGHVAGAVLHCTPDTAAATATSGWPMTVAHLLATAATAWLLVRGESSLWSLTDRLVRAATAAPGSWPQRRVPQLLAPAPAAAASVPRTSAAPRGPPVLVVC
jgi:hypothetical protein